MNQKELTAQARKEKEPPKQDQELKFATMYAQKLISHAQVLQDLQLAEFAEFEIDF